MFLQINDIDRNIYMIASIVKDGKTVIYKMINGTQLQETFDTEQAAESKYEEAIEMTGGGGGNIPLDPDGKIPAEYLPSYVDDVEDLLAVTDTAPVSCAKGDKYYNTTEKKIFTASSTDTWGSTGKTPEKDKIYVNTADNPATSWRWSGTELVMIGGGAIVDGPVYKVTQNTLDILGLKKGVYVLDTTILTSASMSFYYSPYRVGNYTYNVNLMDGTFKVLVDIDSNLDGGTPVMESASLVGGTVRICTIKVVDNGSSGVEAISRDVESLVTTAGSQNITGKKTFTTLPESSVVPTTNNQLVNKKYVDDSIKPVFLGTSGDYCTQQTALDLTNLDVGVYSLINSAKTFSSPDKMLYVKITVNGVDKYASHHLGYNVKRPVIISVIKKAPYDSGLNVLAYIDLNEILDSDGKVGHSVGQIRYNSNTDTFDILNYVNKTQPVTIGDDQTITSKKTFNTLPESSVVPTTDNQLVNKKYVDDNMGNIQYSTMPTASVDFLDEIIQYTGTTSNGYTKGYFYVCESDGGDPATYSWSQINVQPQGSSPSPVLPENGTRLLKKAANSVQALGLIDDPAVDDACLVLTDEVVEHRTLTPIELENGIEANTNIVFGKDNSFTFTGNVSRLLTVPNMNMVTVSDGEGFDHSTEWLGFGIAGPNPLDNKSWYFFEFIAGPSSPAAELRSFTGIINAWVCEDPANDPTFVYIDDGESVAQLLDGFGYDVYEYGMTEYTTSTDLVHLFDSIASSTQGQYTYKDFVGLTISKEDITTETYKKSDLYTYNGSEWVYRDRNLSANANWDENDPTAPGYVRGRTHYTIPGSGEEITTVDLSDDSIYTLTEGQPVNPDIPEKTQAGLYTQDDVLDVQDVIDFYDKLEKLYNEGYSSSDKTFIVEYGSRRNQAYVMKEEVQGEYPYIAYYIIGKDEQQDTYPSGNSTLGLEFGVTKDYQGSEFIGYYIFMNIYTEVFEAESSCRVLSVVEGSKDQVVKLDPKYIPQTADWNENNSKATGYIANRTHYKEVGTETRDIATEDLSEFDTSSSQTEESVDYYTSHLEYRKNLESPHDEEGNIKAKDLYTDLSAIYNTLGSGTEISIKIGDTVVSGKLLKYTQVIDPYNRLELLVVATDGGEPGDNENPMGTVADKFMTDSQNSSGVLLAVSYEMIQESN